MENIKNLHKTWRIRKISYVKYESVTINTGLIEPPRELCSGKYKSNIRSIINKSHVDSLRSSGCTYAVINCHVNLYKCQQNEFIYKITHILKFYAVLA